MIIVIIHISFLILQITTRYAGYLIIMIGSFTIIIVFITGFAFRLWVCCLWDYIFQIIGLLGLILGFSFRGKCLRFIFLIISL